MIPSKWSLEPVTKILILMSISVLLLENLVTATSRSHGYRTDETSLSPLLTEAQDGHFMETSAETRKLQSLGAFMKSDVVNVGTTPFRNSWDNQNPEIPFSQQCSFSQVVVTQGSSSNMPNGMPIFQVTIINNCMQCSMKNIHISCGDWSSATEVDPSIFMKLSFNDCLVNNGSPVASMNSVYFEYTNSFSYPMYVKDSEPCSC